MKIIANYINGKLLSPQSGDYLDVFDPSLGVVYAQAPDSDNREVQMAYEAAAQAFPNWAATSIDERSKILTKIADLMLIMANLFP